MNRLPDEWLDEAELSLLASGYTPNADLQDCSEWSARQVAEIALTDDLIARIRAAERERMAYLARVVSGGGIRDWAAAEAVAAALVEVIVAQEAEINGWTHMLSACRDARDVARAEVAALRKQEWAAPFRREVLADLRIRVERLFSSTPPLYVFTNNERVLFTGMVTTMVNDALRDVWRSASEQVIDLIEEASNDRA